MKCILRVKRVVSSGSMARAYHSNIVAKQMRIPSNVKIDGINVNEFMNERPPKKITEKKRVNSKDSNRKRSSSTNDGNKTQKSKFTKQVNKPKTFRNNHKVIERKNRGGKREEKYNLMKRTGKESTEREKKVPLSEEKLQEMVRKRQMRRVGLSKELEKTFAYLVNGSFINLNKPHIFQSSLPLVPLPKEWEHCVLNDKVYYLHMQRRQKHGAAMRRYEFDLNKARREKSQALLSQLKKEGKNIPISTYEALLQRVTYPDALHVFHHYRAHNLPTQNSIVLTIEACARTPNAEEQVQEDNYFTNNTPRFWNDESVTKKGVKIDTYDSLLKNMTRFLRFLLTNQKYEDKTKEPTLSMLYAYMRVLSRHSQIDQIKVMYEQIISLPRWEQSAEHLDSALDLLRSSYVTSKQNDEHLVAEETEIDDQDSEWINDDDLRELLDTDPLSSQQQTDDVKSLFHMKDQSLSKLWKTVTQDAASTGSAEVTRDNLLDSIQHQHGILQSEKDSLLSLKIDIHALMIHSYVQRGLFQSAISLYDSLKSQNILDIRLLEAVCPAYSDPPQLVKLIQDSLTLDGLQFPTRSMLDHIVTVLPASALLALLKEYAAHRVHLRTHRKKLVQQAYFATYEDVMKYIHEFDHYLIILSQAILSKPQGHLQIGNVVAILRLADVFFSRESLYLLWLAAIDRRSQTDLHSITMDDLKPLLLFFCEKPLHEFSLHPRLERKYRLANRKNDFVIPLNEFIHENFSAYQSQERKEKEYEAL